MGGIITSRIPQQSDELGLSGLSSIVESILTTHDPPVAQFFSARADIHLPADVLGPSPVTFDVHAFVVRRDADVVLVDTLAGPHHIDLIEAALAAADADFSAVRYIVLTHHHPDHTGGLAEIARRAPQAQIVCGAGDLAAIAGSTGVRVDAIGPADTVMGLEVIDTPGHTPGHICLFDAASSTMLLGDLAGNRGGLERAPASFTADPVQYEFTLRSLAERQFTRALPSHGDAIPDDASSLLVQLSLR